MRSQQKKEANSLSRGQAVSAAAPDFTDLERDLVSELLYQRYLKPVWPELADSELQLDPAVDDLTVCPTLFEQHWVKSCNIAFISH